MRVLSLTLREALNAQETGEELIVLVTITHPDLEDGPIRLSSNPTTRFGTAPLLYGTVSRGDTYLFVPFSAVLPDEKDEAPPASQLMIDNIDREMIRLLRSTITPASVVIEVVRGSDVDEVEIAVPAFDLANASYGDASITLTLGIDAMVTEPYPSGTFSPSAFPGLF